MPINDRHQTAEPPRASLRWVRWAVLVGAFTIPLAVITFVWRSDPSATGSPPAPASSRPVTTTSLIEKDEVKSRLSAILEVRDRAYQTRDIELLRQVYSADCPCLRGDGSAIKQLRKDKAVWVGASTSVRVKKLDKVTDRVWVVVADFNASPFRIETESGYLIRAVERRSEVFRFVLERDLGSGNLLLGLAAPVGENG